MIYSQHNEQDAILAACAKAPRSTLLDCGAWDPIALSNSRALIEAGWSAVLIEPSPLPLRNLVKAYGNSCDVQVVAGAVGCESGWQRMRITDDAVSTADAKRAAEWAKQGGYLGSMWTPVLTIADICNRWGAFDFVNIDTEGSSVDILHALLATEMMPQCICVEYDNRLAEAQMAAHARGYRTALVTNENLVLSLVYPQSQTVTL